nr:hypothetical protein [Tanacetum cinerariifolium]
MDACAVLIRKVEHLEFDKVAQALEITKLKRRVKKLKRRNTVRKLKFRRLQRVGTSQRVETSDETMLDDVSNQGWMIVVWRMIIGRIGRLLMLLNMFKRRRKGVVIRDPEEESTTSTIIPAETKSKDKGKGILVEEPKPLKKKQQIEEAEQYARELHAELNKDIDWDKAADHVKR